MGKKKHPVRYDRRAAYLGAEVEPASTRALHRTGRRHKSTGKWQKQIRSNKYLFSVKALSKFDMVKYVHELRQKGKQQWI
ncbi:MAG: hypothetical protein ABI863_11615 [Ginsengibacter sp.]